MNKKYERKRVKFKLKREKIKYEKRSKKYEKLEKQLYESSILIEKYQNRLKNELK